MPAVNPAEALLIANVPYGSLPSHDNPVVANDDARLLANVADPGTGQAIPVTRSAYIGIVTAGAETNTLAIPTFIGQRLILNMDTRVGGDRVVTSAQAVNQAGNNTLTFGAARDCIVLEAIKVGGAFRWQVTANDGVALTTV
jgi:hypothetical protein